MESLSEGHFMEKTETDKIGALRPRNGGGKLSRSETVTVRLDPRLRYLAELAARKHRRTVSSFIEWAVEESLKHVILEPGTIDGRRREKTIADVASDLWDVDEPDRFAKLALSYPDMLTHEEQTLWKLIRENGLLWRGRYDEDTAEWTWTIEGPNLIIETLRNNWVVFNSVAQGEAPRSALPKWIDKDPNSKPSQGFDKADESIPF